MKVTLSGGNFGGSIVQWPLVDGKLADRIHVMQEDIPWVYNYPNSKKNDEAVFEGCDLASSGLPFLPTAFVESPKA